MPLNWIRGRKSPYACNYFAVLKAGPNTTRREIDAIGKDLRRALEVDKKALCACGHEVDHHQGSEAASKLLDMSSLAEELLLIHPQPPRDNREKVRALIDNVQKAAALPLLRNPIPLDHPAAVFWFAPPPGLELAPLPKWEDLGLTRAGDPEDLALDIVFDS